MSQPLFLGFSQLEDLAAEVARDPAADAPGRTVFLMPVEPEYGSPGIGRSTCWLTAHALLPSGAVGYCRIRLGEYDTLNGQVFDDKQWERLQRRRLDAVPVVTLWLEEHGFRVVPATFAAPADYRFLSGRAGFLRYDKESDTFVRATGGEANP
jgi:hypothetical protein